MFFSLVHSTPERAVKSQDEGDYTNIGVRAGGGGLGGLQPPSPILDDSDFLGSKRNIWAKPIFKEVSMFFLFSIEEMNIFYFNVKSVW